MFQVPNLTSNLNVLVALSVIAVTFMVYTIASNILVLWAILRSRRNGVHNNISKLLMASMTTNDLLLSVFVVPYQILLLINNGRWILGLALCGLWQELNLIICSIGAWHILSLALDKCVAICRPLTYRLLSNKAAMLMIAVSWIIPTGSLLLPKINNSYSYPEYQDFISTNFNPNTCMPSFSKTFFTTYIFLLFFFPLTISYILYFIIYLEIRRFSKRMKTFSNKIEATKNVVVQPRAGSISTKTSIFSTEIQDTCNKANQQKSLSVGAYNLPKHIRKQRKAIITIGSIVAVFTIFWMPTSIYFLTWVLLSPDVSIEMLRNSTIYGLTISTDSLPATTWVFIGLYWFSFLTSTVNPFLYCTMKSVRAQVKSLLCNRNCV